MLGFLEQIDQKLSRRRSSVGEDRDKLCTTCQELNIRNLLKCDPVLRRQEWCRRIMHNDLRSRRRVCEFCSLLLECIELVCDSQGTRYVDKKVDYVEICVHAKNQLKIVIQGTWRLPINITGSKRGESYDRQEFTEDFYLQEYLASLAAESLGQPLLDVRPIDFEEVQRWLSTCRKTHGKACDPATGFGFVSRPKKLTVLDVKNYCLVDLPPGADYAALSYVWGGVQLLHLNRHNAADLRKPEGLYGTEYKNMIPATIRDAIIVTNSINLRYLWIDSLCIPQDEPVETALQVADMHNIFGSAYVTLIAAEGTSVDSGLAGVKERARQIRYGIKSVKDDGKAVARELASDLLLGLVALDGYTTEHDPKSWNVSKGEALPRSTRVSQSVWNGRAWTLQEWELSSRTLVFQDSQVFWHCGKATWCEPLLGRKINTLGFAEDKRYTRLGNLSTNPHFTNSWEKTDYSIELRRDGRSLIVSSEALLLYKDIVTAYTPRNIGKPEDKLRALRGVTKVLEKCFKCEMLYGLPESHLDIALLWQAQRSIIDNNREKFPSWSWAAWKGAIQYEKQYGIERGQARDLYEHESPEERIRCLVRWYKPDGKGGFEPINDRGHGIKEVLRDNGHMPQGWDGVLAAETNVKNRNIDIKEPCPFPQLLRCYTMRAKFPIAPQRARHNTVASLVPTESNELVLPSTTTIENYFRIFDPETGDRLVGELIFDTEQSLEYGVDLIALSETQFFRSEDMNLEVRGNLFKKPFAYDLFNVMAVTFSDDGKTASRRGLGRVFKDEWDKARPEYLWVNLR